MADRHETEHKSFGSPDETREFPNGRAEIVNVGGGEVGRLVFEPGWRLRGQQLRQGELTTSGRGIESSRHGRIQGACR